MGMTVFLFHNFKQPNTQHISFPRRIRARGLQTSRLRQGFGGQVATREGWAERRQAPGACEAPVPANNARGRGACEAPRRPLRSGRRASRRSIRGDFRLRFRVSGPAISCGSTCSELLAARVIVPGERFPSLPRERLRAVPAGRHSSLRLQDRL